MAEPSRQPDAPPPPNDARLDAKTVVLIGLAIPLALFLCIVVAQALFVGSGPRRDSSLFTQATDMSRELEADRGKVAGVQDGDREISDTKPFANEIQKADQPTVAPAPESSPPTVAPIGPPPPWQAALDLEGRPPSFTTIAFQSFDDAFDVAGRDDLTPWFERVGDAGLRLGKIPTQHGHSGTIEGIGRLKSPWLPDGVLRLTLDNFNRLKLHFFHGNEGITLVYYEDQGYRWAAYKTARDHGKSTPKTWAITATDDDRCRRTELRFGGPIEIRYRDKELLLSRGDVVLLAAPLAGPPTDVFFDGRATIHGIALARTKDAPRPWRQSPIEFELDEPAKLDWSRTRCSV